MNSKELTIIFFFIGFSVFQLGCYRMRMSKGGGQIDEIPQRKMNSNDIVVHPGYKIEPIASGFTFPTGCAFDDENRLYVIEAGYSYGEVWDSPKLIRVDVNGHKTVVATGPENGPWTGITWHSGFFYVAEGGEMEGGRILRITKEGVITALISNLPGMGDHHTNGPAIKDDYIYFGQGTATNSGVVGNDNAEFGWLLRRKSFHDIPCKDIILSGENYSSEDVLNKTSTATTGAYVPFGTATAAGQIVKGAIPCTGSIMRIPINGGNAEMVAWGFRNPFGLAFSPDEKLYVTENGFDDRGSRPVWGAADVLWEVQTGAWYGWPDFSAGKPLTSNEEFKVPGKEAVKPVLKSNPGTPPKPAALFGVHSSSNGFDFSRNKDFGFQGEAFVAQFGDMAPGVGKVLSPVGFKVVRVDVENGVVRDFATNKGKRNGPATWLQNGGLERPVSVKFDPPGQALYIVDFGIVKTTDQGPRPQANTGVVWKITKR